MYQAGASEQLGHDDMAVVMLRRLVQRDHPQRLGTDHDMHPATLWHPPGGDIAHRRRHLAVHDATLDLVHLAEEGDHEGVGGSTVEVQRRSRLHDSPLTHQHDAIRHEHGFLGVVGHQQHAGAHFLQHVQRIVADAVTQARIETGKRFVEQHQLRCRRQRPGQRDALLLPTRQHVREDSRVALHAQQFKQFMGPAAPLLSGLGLEPEGHVVEHRQMREQRRILEGQADVTFLGRHMGTSAAPHRLATQLHMPLLHLLEARGDAQQRGLAAP